MTRSDYLAQLDKYLRKLPEDDYQQAMDYFREYFDEAGPDQEAAVMAELGSPKEAAQEILANLLEEKTTTSSWSKLSLNQSLTFVGLSILAAPLALPLLLVALVVIVTIVILAFSLLLVLASLSLAGFVSGGALLWESFTSLSSSLATLSMGLGASLLSFGLALVFLCLIYYLSRATKFTLLKLGHAISQGRKKS